MFYTNCQTSRFRRLLRCTSRVMFGSPSRLLHFKEVTGRTKGDIKLEVGPRYSARRKRRVCSPYTPKDHVNAAEMR